MIPDKLNRVALEDLDSPAFSIKCEGGDAGSFCVRTQKLSVTVAQTVCRNGSERMWDFVLLLSDRRKGISITRVLLCHPDWDEPMEIARVESHSGEVNVHFDGVLRSRPQS